LVVTRVDPFLRASIAEIDPRIMTIPEKRLVYAHFAFGAIAELATEQEVDETQCLAALVVCLQRTPEFSPQDVSHLVGRCMNTAGQAQSDQARQAGAQGVRDWEAKVTPKSPSPLVALLTP
jgi:hypothetical protein